ncbi:hypothetical protein [Vibrio owensii]|uniref:hypothetical protein n=1 Tax=Vibrio owensii TaxID=696485 RepID=UPI003CC5F2A2
MNKPNEYLKHLNGNQVHKILKDASGNVEKVILKFGILYLPLVGKDVNRLKIDTVTLDEPDEILGSEIEHYYLDIRGLKLTDTMEALHFLRGTTDTQWESFWLDNMEIKREREQVIPDEYKL